LVILCENRGIKFISGEQLLTLIKKAV